MSFFFLWPVISMQIKLEYCHTNFFILLTVDIVTTPQETIPREYERSPEETPNSTEPSILLSAVFTTLGVAVLVVIGVLYHQKHRGIDKISFSCKLEIIKLFTVFHRMLPYKRDPSKTPHILWPQDVKYNSIIKSGHVWAPLLLSENCTQAFDITSWLPNSLLPYSQYRENWEMHSK